MAEPTSQTTDPSLAKEGIASKTQIKQKDPVLSERDLLLARMDQQIVQAREQDDETFYKTADPRAIAMAAEMRAEAAGTGAVDHNGQPRDPETGKFVSATPATDVEAEGLAEATPIVEEPQAPADPLAEFIVEGKLKTVVDGKIVMVPLDQARTQLQKQQSADARLAQAAARQKELDARERQIKATEANLMARAAQPVSTPVDDASFDTEATELVRSLVSDPEAKAAQKLAGVLKKIRAATPQIDVSAITAHAVHVAKEEIAVESYQRALVSGAEAFKKSYPDIAADPDLYNFADRKTTAIAEEHPEWEPAQVMLEAGKQTRDWVAKLSGKPAASTSPNTSVADLNKRQQLKQKLTPMPQSRSARPAPEPDENADYGPGDYMAEIRKARGQAS